MEAGSGDGAGWRGRVARSYFKIWRAMTIRLIWLVPS